MTLARQPLLPQGKPKKRGINRSALSGGCFVVAPAGWGRSRLLGRRMCFQYATKGVGTVLIDVAGGSIDNALDKLLYLPKQEQLDVIDRLRYVDMAGEEGSVTSWPMLAKRSEKESLYLTSQRLFNLIAQTDQKFADATIQGLRRTEPILTSTCILLAALGLPISFADDLLQQPELWVDRVQLAARQNPQAKEAASDFLAYTALPRKEREVRSEPLRNRLNFLKHDAVSRAMFASTRESLIDWEEVARQGLSVYIDLRSPLQSQWAREVKLFWVFNSLMEFIESRGAAGHEYPPLALVIDELSYFVRGSHLNTNVIVDKFSELIDVRMRNANIWLTAATQDMTQLPPALLASCLRMKTHLYGAITDYEAAIDRARRWFRMNPWEVKHWRTVWGSQNLQGLTEYFPIDHEPEFQPLAEQEYLNSRRFVELKKGEWFFAESKAEGHMPLTVRKITTNTLDRGQYEAQNKALIKKLKRYLMKRDGLPVAKVLAEIEAQKHALQQPERKDGAPPLARVPQAPESFPLLVPEAQGFGNGRAAQPQPQEQTKREAPAPQDGTGIRRGLSG